MPEGMQIAVVGAGAWGTALAISAASRGHAVSLHVRDPDQLRAMQRERINTRYLPGADFPAGLVLAPWAGRLASGPAAHDLLIIATPMAAVRGVLEQVRELAVPVAWLCKGFEEARDNTQAVGLMAHEIARQVAPELRVGVLSGPSFAQEVARNQPTAVVAASPDAQVRAVDPKTGHETAGFAPAAGIFYDRNDSLLWSLTTSPGENLVSVNVYPGVLPGKARAIGIWGVYSRSGHLSLGLLHRKSLGLGLGFGR